MMTGFVRAKKSCGRVRGRRPAVHSAEDRLSAASQYICGGWVPSHVSRCRGLPYGLLVKFLETHVFALQGEIQIALVLIALACHI